MNEMHLNLSPIKYIKLLHVFASCAAQWNHSSLESKSTGAVQENESLNINIKTEHVFNKKQIIVYDYKLTVKIM